MHCLGSGAGQQCGWGQDSLGRVAAAREKKGEGGGGGDTHCVDWKCSLYDAPVKESLSTQGEASAGARKDVTTLQKLWAHH